MKRTFKTGAAVLFVALNATSAFASLSDGASIEMPNTGTESVRVLDSILGNISHPELTGSMLNSYSHSSQPAAILLEGSSIGQEVAQLAVRSSANDNQSWKQPQLYAAPPDIFKYAGHLVGAENYQFSSTPDLATRVTMNIVNLQDAQLPVSEMPNTITGDVTATPLPAAGILLASGLLTLPLFRQRRCEAV